MKRIVYGVGVLGCLAVLCVQHGLSAMILGTAATLFGISLTRPEGE